MVTTSNCCFCFSLRTGTLIIGWLHTIGAVFSLAANITAKASGSSSDLSTAADGTWSSIIYACVQMLVGIALLYGVYKHQRQPVYLFVVFQSILIIIDIVLVILLIIYVAVSQVALVVSVSIIRWLFQTYLIVVVYSFHNEMDSIA